MSPAALKVVRPLAGSARSLNMELLVALLAVVVLLISVGGGSGGGWWGPMGTRMDDMMGRCNPDGSGPAAIRDAGEITVAMTELEFDPAILEVTVGEPVNLTLIKAAPSGVDTAAAETLPALRRPLLRAR